MCVCAVKDEGLLDIFAYSRIGHTRPNFSAPISLFSSSAYYLLVIRKLF